MQRLYATAALFLALALITPQDGQVVAASPDATQTPEQTVPQNNGAPGADNGAQSSPPTRQKGVIAPPKTSDDGIYTQVPNPNAGTKEDVIPPPGYAWERASERRAALIRPREALPRLEPTQQSQYNDDDEDEADNSRRPIPPTSTMTPPRNE